MSDRIGFVGGELDEDVMRSEKVHNLEKMMVCGLGPETFRIGEKKNVTATVQARFRPERIVIPDAISMNFVIHDIRIGLESQMAAPGAIPSSAFSSSAF